MARSRAAIRMIAIWVIMFCVIDVALSGKWAEATAIVVALIVLTATI
jgi:hypothetical protein